MLAVFSAILGTLLCLGNIPSFFPQIFKLLKKKNSEGLSFLTLFFPSMAQFCNLIISAQSNLWKLTYPFNILDQLGSNFVPEDIPSDVNVYDSYTTVLLFLANFVMFTLILYLFLKYYFTPGGDDMIFKIFKRRLMLCFPKIMRTTLIGGIRKIKNHKFEISFIGSPEKATGKIHYSPLSSIEGKNEVDIEMVSKKEILMSHVPEIIKNQEKAIDKSTPMGFRIVVDAVLAFGVSKILEFSRDILVLCLEAIIYFFFPKQEKEKKEKKKPKKIKNTSSKKEKKKDEEIITAEDVIIEISEKNEEMKQKEISKPKKENVSISKKGNTKKEKKKSNTKVKKSMIILVLTLYFYFLLFISVFFILNLEVFGLSKLTIYFSITELCHVLSYIGSVCVILKNLPQIILTLIERKPGSASVLQTFVTFCGAMAIFTFLFTSKQTFIVYLSTLTNVFSQAVLLLEFFIFWLIDSIKNKSLSIKNFLRFISN